MSADLGEAKPSDNASPGETSIRSAGSCDLELLAALHGACFEERWDAAAMAALLAMPGAGALIALAPPGPACPTGAPVGLALLRAVAGEAEILSIGVVPQARRAGIGRRLLGATVAFAAAAGAARLFLEVAADNLAARALYGRAGFNEVGERREYYRRPGAPMRALVMAKDVDSVYLDNCTSV
jgi:ribosomal-protein-alanine N-acetyltransferase